MTAACGALHSLTRSWAGYGCRLLPCGQTGTGTHARSLATRRPSRTCDVSILPEDGLVVKLSSRCAGWAGGSPWKAVPAAPWNALKGVLGCTGVPGTPPAGFSGAHGVACAPRPSQGVPSRGCQAPGLEGCQTGSAAQLGSSADARGRASELVLPGCCTSQACQAQRGWVSSSGGDAQLPARACSDSLAGHAAPACQQSWPPVAPRMRAEQGCQPRRVAPRWSCSVGCCAGHAPPARVQGPRAAFPPCAAFEVTPGVLLVAGRKQQTFSCCTHCRARDRIAGAVQGASCLDPQLQLKLQCVGG